MHFSFASENRQKKTPFQAPVPQWNILFGDHEAHKNGLWDKKKILDKLYSDNSTTGTTCK
jgi:hypothetical protein